MATELWTLVYADVGEDESGKLALVHYVRLVPGFMDVAAAGYPHGLSIGGAQFPTNKQAKLYGQRVASFMGELEHTLDAMRAGDHSLAPGDWACLREVPAEDGTGLQVWLAPRFMALALTEFPEGLWLGARTFTDRSEAETFLASVTHFLCEMYQDWQVQD